MFIDPIQTANHVKQSMQKLKEAMKKPIEMTEITIPRQLAKDIHFELDGELKEKLGEYLPKEKLQLGRWIKDDKYPKWMMFYTDETIAYGFNVSGKWKDASSFYNNSVLLNSWDGNRYATPEEIKAALVAEAERLGYENGNYECLSSLTDQISNKDKFYCFDFQLNQLWIKDKSGRVNCIFHDGQWAEIITLPASLQAAINELGKDEILKLLK